MRPRLLAVPLLAAFALLLPNAHAAGTAFVVADPAGDANFSGIHRQSGLPGSQSGFDLASVTFETTKTVSYKVVTVKGKKKKVAVRRPTGIAVTLRMVGKPSTDAGSAYGLSGVHSECGDLRMQIYYTDAGPKAYGDLGRCGDGDATSERLFTMQFSPKVVGNAIVLAVPFSGLPKAFKVGTSVQHLVAYTTLAEYVVGGIQPTDVDSNAGIDIVTADGWQIG